MNLVTLIEHLRASEKLDAAGGITYITQISDSVPTTAHLQSYIKIVEEKSMLRKLIRASTNVIEDCYARQNDVEKVLDSAEKKIFDIAEKRSTNDFEPINAILERGFLEIERLYNNKGQVTGVESGLGSDTKTSGFQKGTDDTGGGRPSMGKTTFALNLWNMQLQRLEKA